MKIGDLCRSKTGFHWLGRYVAIGDLVIVMKIHAPSEHLQPIFLVLHQRTGQKYSMPKEHLEKVNESR